MSNFLNPVRLEKKHIQHCKLLTDRYAILEHLPKNAVVAEIGVLAGDFSQHILDVTKPSKLYLIDTFNIGDWHDSKDKRFFADNHFEFVEKRFKNEIQKNVVSLKQGISWDKLAEFESNYFDWLYIDGDHRYIGVSRDLEQAVRVLKPNGYLVMNDYIYYSHAENIPYGVIHAVNELCVNKNFEMTYFALHPQMYCDVVIRKM